MSYIKSDLAVSKVIFLFLFFQLVAATQAQATDEKYASLPLKGSNNQIAKDSFNVVQDTVFYNLALRPTQTTFSVRNLITFKLDEYANLALPDTFKVTITFKVYFTKLVGSTVVSDSSALQTVFVEYNKFRNYQSKAVYRFTGGFQSQAKIFSVTSTSSSGTFASYKNVLQLENEIQVTREYAFNPNVNVVQSIAGVQGSSTDADSCSSAGEFMVNWGKVAAADEYDLEWAYIDSSALANYYVANTTTFDPKKIFANNASRVSISSESYQIPILYDNGGILFFRVRPVRVKQTGQRIEATWSSNYVAGMGSYSFAGHERGLNWQASTSYAEEGKRKSVVQYFDGVLKSRQTVTKDNNTCFTIVAETMYDYQGRPVIQVMPAPTLNRLIGFTPHFNRDINGADYEKTIFDGDATGGVNNCNALLPGMGTMSGSSLYYSPSNTLASNGIHKYIPDAHLFPFTETRYTSDNTGRIAMQGGVGKEFQINQPDPIGYSHESRYFYGSADQEELDALFGTEVGNASHYTKNMVRDANGQYSVSYVDMHGRTIATALAGKPQSNLDSLTSHNVKTIVKKLLDTTNNLVVGTSIISTKALIVTQSGSHRLQYSMLPDSISIVACDQTTICYDCLYDLEVVVSNDCSNPGDQPITISRTNISPQGVMDINCNIFGNPVSIDTSITLMEGSYLITKKLTISQTGLSKYNEIFLERNTCKTLEQFIEEQRLLLASKIQCFPTCQQCTDSLGTWDAYRLRYMNNNNIANIDTALFRDQAFIAYNAQKENCDDLCNATGKHHSIRAQMLTDMTPPYGQYAEIANAYDGDNIFYKNIFNRTFRFQKILPSTYFKDEYGRPDSLVNNSGEKVAPTHPSVTTQNFLDNWKDSWAETLLPLHPEYCQLTKFESYAASHLWDERFSRVETFKQAVDSGFLNPSAFSGMPANAMFNPPSTAARDPFFTSLETGQATAFKDSLFKFVETEWPELNAWSLATIMAHCKPEDTSCYTLYKPFNMAFVIDTACRGELDFAWRYFREMYQNEKAEFVSRAVLNSCASAGILPWHTLNFPDIDVLTGTDGMTTDLGAANDSLTSFIDQNCRAYATQWVKEMKPCNLDMNDSTQIINRLIGVCKAGGNADHVYGSSTTKPGTTSGGDTSFIQVLKSVLGSRYDSTCNAYLITAPKPYDKQPAYGGIEVWDTPDSCQCSRISSLYQQFQSSPDTSFSAYVYRVTNTRIYPGVLDTLRKVCSGELNCNFLATPLILPPALQCNVTNTCVDCATVSNVYDKFKVEFPGITPTPTDVDSTEQARNRLFEKYMNWHLGFSKGSGEYLSFLDSCSTYIPNTAIYTPHYDVSGCDSTIWKVTDNKWNHRPGIRINDYIQNGIWTMPEYDTANAGTGNIKIGQSYVDTLCLDNYFIYENRVRFPIEANHLQMYINQGRSAALYGTYFDEFHFDNNFHAYIWLVKGTYWHPAKIDSIYAYVQISENGVTTVNHALLPTGFKDLSQWHTVKVEFKNSVLKVYLNGQLFDEAAYTTTFSKFLTHAVDPYGYDLEVDWVKMYDENGSLRFFEDFIGCDSMALQTLPRCKDVCSPLEQLISKYQKQYIKPSLGYVDYDMRTFAGTKTLDAGPKGVFDINKNLIGNTVSGTVSQIKASYVQVWNSSTTNQAVGTLSLLSNGKFRLQLNQGATAPCDGILGMRFYQFDAPTDTLDGVRVGAGSYVDFGDTKKEQIVKGLDARGTRVLDYPQTSSQSGYLYNSSDSVVVTPGTLHVVHIYPDSSLKTITVYHPDVEAILSLDGFLYRPYKSLQRSTNLRGYMPEYALEYIFHSTQDSSVNSFQNISNFNQVTTLQSFNIFSHNEPSPWGQMQNTNYSGFSANLNLRSINYVPYNGVPGSNYNVQSWSTLFPNLKINYPNLRSMSVHNFFGEYNSSVDLSIPTLRSFTLTGYLTATEIDSIIIQVSRSLQDSGLINLSDLDGTVSVRTTASDAAYNSLAARKWRLIGGGMNLTNPAPANVLVPLRDSLPLTNNFTEFYNQQYGTSYSYNQLMAVLKSQYGYTPDFCTPMVKTCPGNNDAPKLCGDTEGAFPAVDIPDLTPCADSTLFSVGVGTKLYEAYRDSLINSFNNRYLEKCLKARYNESFTITAPISEFHYTLYYYDQAGNLVKTIPPAGVDVSKFGWATLYSDSVKTSRANNQARTPSHVLPTQYRYNSLNQVVAQTTPDAGTSKFWYDRVGRLAISQNARQKANSGTELNALYSYTKYDYLGRIAEVGQIKNTFAAEPITSVLTRNNTTLNSWYTARNTVRGQITQTVYDLKYAGYVGSENSTIWQRNLRNRVSFTSYTDTATLTGFNNQTVYSYDIHGNVDTLLQDYGISTVVSNVMNAQTVSNRWKRVVYKYDLINGKVNHVAYQSPRGTTYYPDMFYHRYSYDAENRLTLAETSMDSVVWEKEARYDYYRHGPLARTTLGEQLVQGTDYAYTLQGWLKGVNAISLTNAATDMGSDGKVGALNQYVGRDALGFNLNYFAGDYSSINTTVIPFPAATSFIGGYKPLYNGNINSMAVNIKFPSPTGVQDAQLYNYNYDQLNRITGMDVYRGLNQGTNSWAGMPSTPVTDYKERVSYDGNGNILTYLRNGTSSSNINMDNLTYNYYANTNQLKYVQDNVTDANYADDIDNQTNTSNYVYDPIGNLIKDVKENITLIKWNVYGKITEIQRTATTANPVTFIYYTYDAVGNRISKRVDKNGTNVKEYTWYVRDASGNVMATYNSTGSNSNLSSYTLNLTEQHMYGSSRLGIINRNVSVKAAFTNPSIINFARGNKFFELSNHLGNVLAVISDKKVPVNNGGVVDYYNADIVSANDYYPFGMAMPGRSSTTANSYRYGFNGQEKSNDIGLGNYNAEFWQYDSRLGRRWNLDPKPTIGISDYSVLGSNPIVNVDPNGDLFFGLFGSTSAQRRGARKLRNETDGKINNLYKKDINVLFRTWGEESSLQDKSSDPTQIRGVVANAYRTYFDKETGAEKGTDYYDRTLKSWKQFETVSSYKPDFYDNWEGSENILAKGSYSLVNSFYVTGQNLITKRFTGDLNTINLTGQVSTVKENVEAFTSVATTFIPAEKTIKGIAYLEKLNAAQFSKFFKGTIVARAEPAFRGQMNKGLNYIFVRYNGVISSGKVVLPVVKLFKPKEEE